MPVGTQPARGRELRKGRALVIAPLGQPLQSLLAEHVEAAAHPVGQERRLAEAGNDVAVEVDDPERGAQRADGDRGRDTARPVQGGERPQVDVEELVPVQRVERAAAGATGAAARARGAT